MGILRNFLFLDETQLNQYISQVEDGLRGSANRSMASDKDKKAELDAKIAKFALGKKNLSSESQTYEDNGAARFDRLLSLVEGFEDDFGWVDLEEQPDDIASLRPGHILECSAELYESELTRLTASSGMLSMLPLVKAFSRMPGVNADGLDGIDDGTVDAMGSFGAAMKGASIILGDVHDTEWKLVASIPAEVDVDGDAYVVGKVSKIWGAGTWRPLPGLPIISQMPREQRREFERKGPDEEGKMMWVEGPAVQLEMLAIYR
jgi:hypothetical protein